MTAVERRGRPALVAAVVLPAAAVAGLVLLAANGSAPSPAAAPTTAAAPATTAAAPTTAPVESAPVESAPVESAPVDSAATTVAAGFADADEARTAAEGLIPPYIQSQFQVDVTDAACSKPATGASGEQFVCYGLKPGDLVIALRATIGEERLVDLTLITDQQPPPTIESVATTDGG